MLKLILFQTASSPEIFISFFSLVRNEYQVENINMDKEGRIIIFETGGMTCGNV